MICKLLQEVLCGFQMKGKMNKGGFYFMHLLTEPEMAMNILKNLLVYIVKNDPGNDAYVILTII